MTIPVKPHPIAERLNDFCTTVQQAGCNPDDRWVIGYVDYEWDHLRPLLYAYGLSLAGQHMLELGCNVGGSSVVCAAMGARVEAVDIDPRLISIAQANAWLHDVDQQVKVHHVADTRHLPFVDGAFDFVLANSVLEYVHPDHLTAIVAELGRVLRTGGILAICGTSNRMMPREMHSRRWMVNYLPRAIWPGAERGIAPWQLARLIGDDFDITGQDKWIAARRAIHDRAGFFRTALHGIGRATGIAPGWLGPSIEIIARRR